MGVSYMISVAARPYPFDLNPSKAALVVIDMQRDFIEPGGFGAALGNDVARLTKIVPTVAGLIALFRKHKLPIVHTREAHKPDLSDCPPAKRLRGKLVHVNLIPLNPTPGWPTVGSSPARVREFRDLLERLGVNATVRRNRGTDIDAACGQLAAGQPVELRAARPRVSAPGTSGSPR